MSPTPGVVCQCGRCPQACSAPLAASLSTREAADCDHLSLLSLSDLLISLSLQQHLISLSASPRTDPGARTLATRHPAPDAAAGGEMAAPGPANSWTPGTHISHRHGDLTINLN